MHPSALSNSVEKRSIIDMWKTSESNDFAYFDAAEASTPGFWSEGSVYKSVFDTMDTSIVVEIACGKGRHAAHILERCQKLYLVDTSIDAIAYAKRRFENYPHVSAHVSSDGESFPFLQDDSVSAVFSYDAMVHFELLTIAAYLNEIARVLRPGGRALLHHSNYSKNPTGSFTENPGWRNFMSCEIIAHLASRARLTVLSSILIDWAEPQSDALTLFEKPT